MRYLMLGLVGVILLAAVGYGADSGWQAFANSNYVTSIWPGGSRVMWGSRGGVVYYDRETATFGEKTLKSENGLRSSVVSAVAADAAGRTWIGTEYKGLCVLDGGTWQFHDTENFHLLSDYVLDIATYGDMAAVGTSAGMSLFKDGQFQSFFSGNDWQRSGCDSVLAVAIADEQSLVGTECGVFALRLENRTWSQLIPNKGARHIAYDGDSLFWILTYDSIYTYNGSDLRLIPRKFIEPDLVRDIGAHGASVWVITSNGPSRYDFTNKWWTRSKTGLPADLMDARRVRVAEDGTAWIGTKNGAGWYGNGSWTIVASPGPGSNYVQDICVENSGRVWFTTGYRFRGGPLGSDVGILRYTPATGGWDQLAYPTLPSNRAFACETNPADGLIWVGYWESLGGLASYNPSTDQWRSYGDSLESRVVSAIYIDPNENVVFSEYTWGLGIRTKDGDFIHYSAEDEVRCLNSRCVTAVGPGFGDAYMLGNYFVSTGENCEAEVVRLGVGGDLLSKDDDTCDVWNTTAGWPQGMATYTFALDQFGVQWLGSGGGLGAYDPAGQRWHRTNTQLGSVWDIEIDQYGDRWIACDKGLFVIKGYGLDWADFEKVDVYDSDNSPLEPVPVKALEFDADGSLWIGTAGGGIYNYVPARPEPGRHAWINVFPNPYVARQKASADGIRFSEFMQGTTLRIYTVAGDLVDEINPEDAWDTTNGAGEEVVSGVYIYAGQALDGSDFKGKLVIVRLP